MAPDSSSPTSLEPALNVSSLIEVDIMAAVHQKHNCQKFEGFTCLWCQHKDAAGVLNRQAMLQLGDRTSTRAPTGSIQTPGPVVQAHEGASTHILHASGCAPAFIVSKQL